MQQSGSWTELAVVASSSAPVGNEEDVAVAMAQADANPTTIKFPEQKGAYGHEAHGQNSTLANMSTRDLLSCYSENSLTPPQQSKQSRIDNEEQSAVVVTRAVENEMLRLEIREELISMGLSRVKSEAYSFDAKNGTLSLNTDDLIRICGADGSMHQQVAIENVKRNSARLKASLQEK